MKKTLLSIGLLLVAAGVQAQNTAIWGTDFGTNLATSATTSPSTYRQRIPVAVDTNGFLKVNVGTNITITGATLTWASTNGIVLNNSAGLELGTTNAPLGVSIVNDSQSGIGVTNFSSFATAFNIYAAPATVTNLAANIVGATNTVVSLTGSTTNKATATTWTYVSHTTTTVPNSFTLYIFNDAPTDPGYTSTNYPIPASSIADQLKLSGMVTFTNTDFRTWGTNSIASVTKSIALSPTNWVVRVCEQARTNVGDTPIDTVIVEGYLNGR